MKPCCFQFRGFASHTILARFITSVLSRNTIEHYLLHSNFSQSVKIRKPKLITMKIESPKFQQLFTPELQKLVDIFKRHNQELRIAGGAVRDILMDKLPHDIDFATTATPTQMKEIFELEGIRQINPQGEKHGTVTARINDKENFEVTTLRIDVVTDGRHAEVEFTKDWMLDANRRDLTINAMFLGFDGTLYDYYNGREDLEKRIVRFVGDPKERIQEDYLRILRYFRFYGRISRGPDNHDPETLSIIKDNAKGLLGISGERIWMEFKQIITGNYAKDIVKTMIACDVGRNIGLPDSCDIKEFESVYEKCRGLDPHYMTLTTALFEDGDQLYDFDNRIKLSNDEVSIGQFIIAYRQTDLGDQPLKYFQYLLIDTAGHWTKAQLKVLELIKYKGQKQVLEEFKEWTPPKFPVDGRKLIDMNVAKGPIFKATLDELQQIWKFSDFKLTLEELLGRVGEIVTKFETEGVPKPQKPIYGRQWKRK
ncbi:hypothetical protein FSP39_023423 [Pinctada imbricata]|uniref:Uncharacterized protein n=1 Tax=Pinctada imbricata TaxID=66713 RepID=A0AA89BSL0_PINIB|nr:hypothetical protein FSP39_023423 [Pinctada imbricata]